MREGKGEHRRPLSLEGQGVRGGDAPEEELEKAPAFQESVPDTMAKTVELDQSENPSLTSYQLDNRGVLLDFFEPQFPGKMGTIAEAAS